jgi:hypothetical protein
VALSAVALAGAAALAWLSTQPWPGLERSGAVEG